MSSLLLLYFRPKPVAGHILAKSMNQYYYSP